MLAMLTGLRVAARGSGPGCAAFDRLRALRSSELQGRDEEQGFSGPNKEQDEEEAAPTRPRLSPAGIAEWRGRKKEAWRGGAKGSSAASFLGSQRYGMRS